VNWRELTPARCRTHHLRNGVPAYGSRYAEVGKFHEPGLAPARDASGALHISEHGMPAYAARFSRTFGFYEGRAAVQASDGWKHILADGSPLTNHRFGWCGNFQEGRCTVRGSDALYHHLTSAGLSAYPARWKYAGDFREGFAVVQALNGLHTHIDTEGQPLHGQWFQDLGVYHKGIAAARDEGGWTHIDGTGSPLYDRRFAAAEPFYNGQARMQRNDGGLEVIDESGATVAELRAAQFSEFSSLSRDVVGYWRTDTIAAAVDVGVFGALPGTGADLADRLGVQQGRLGILLRALAELRLVERQGDKWLPTSRGAFLRRDHPLTLADAAKEFAGPLRDRWRSLDQALREQDWKPADVFEEVAADPERAVSVHRMLRSYARHDYPLVPEALQLRGNEHIVDAGGGLGVLAGLVLAHSPGVSVTVMERPEVVAQIEVNQFGRRLQLAVGDLLRPWPICGDAVILARVLHDWGDRDAITILGNARAALPSGGRVFIIEMLTAEDGSFGGLCDLHLLLSTGGGERTEADYRALLTAAGFEYDGARRLAALPSVVEGVAP
jgi:hypothetical protein